MKASIEGGKSRSTERKRFKEILAAKTTIFLSIKFCLLCVEAHISLKDTELDLIGKITMNPPLSPAKTDKGDDSDPKKKKKAKEAPSFTRCFPQKLLAVLESISSNVNGGFWKKAISLFTVLILGKDFGDMIRAKEIPNFDGQPQFQKLLERSF